MSLETVSSKRNRIYKRKFDHEEAQRLRAEGWTYQRLAEHFKVSERGIARVVDPQIGERMREANLRFLMSRDCAVCGGPCSRYGTSNPDYEASGLCRSCWAESRQTRFRFDAEGNLIQIRCSTCKEWKATDLFPKNRDDSRGKHRQCRECGTRARQLYRQKHKVPCIVCGAPALPPKEKGPRGQGPPRCLTCFREYMKTPEFREKARLAQLKNKSEEAVG